MRKKGGILGILMMAAMGMGAQQIIEGQRKRSSESTAENGSASSTKRKQVKLARKMKLRNQK